MSTTAAPLTDDELTAAAARAIADHFDDFAPDYHLAAFDGAGMQHLSHLDLDNVDRALALVPPGDGRRACDVGVGTGRISSRLLAAGFELRGVDASTGMLEQARRRLPSADLVHGSLAERLPVADGWADLVTCLRVVKYLPDRAAAVAELARVARPGGIVCFDLANARSVARFGYPAGMVWGSVYGDALAMIDAAGLDIVEVRPGVHLPDPMWRRASTERGLTVARAAETAVARPLGRHAARSWTFVTRRRSEGSR
jgi:SAM-dependent methyltransferase